MATENTFGKRLRLLRAVKQNISQKDFAKLLGIPQPTLSSYESGKIKPTVDVIINIAEKCGVSMDWLCGRDEEYNAYHIKSLADVTSLFMGLFETNEFSIKTTIHDHVDSEEKDATDDNDRNWVNLRIYHNEEMRNPECTLNMDLAKIITKAYSLTQELRRYERDQENYEREKQYYVSLYNDVPLTTIDHSELPESERRKRMLECLKEELESSGNGTS